MPHGRGTVDPHDLPEQPSTPTAGAPRARARGPGMLVPVCRLAFPQGIAGPERPLREGGMEVHIPTLPDATPGIEKGGSLRPRPPFPARRSRPGGRGATQIRTTTCEVEDMHVRIAFQRTCTPNSHVRFRIGIRPPPHGAFKSRPQRDGSNTTTDPSSRREAPEAALGRPPVPRRQEPGSNRTRATRRTSSESLVVPYSLDSVTQGTSPTLTRRGQRYRATSADPS